MLDINSLPQFIQPFVEPFAVSERLLIVASLEVLRRHSNARNINSDTLRSAQEQVRKLAEGVDLTVEKLRWHKTCNGWHELKLHKGTTKTKANQIRRDKHREFQSDPKILEVKTENRGRCVRKRYDPFIFFKHVDNCADCDSLPKPILEKSSIPVANAIDLLELQNNDTAQKTDFLYECILKYLLAESLDVGGG